MSVEIANAFVTLIPSAAGIASKIAEELGAPLEQAAKQAGTDASDSLGGSLTEGMKVSGKAAAVAATVAMAAVFAAFQIGDEFDSSFDSIRVQTGKTGVALDELEGSFRSVVSTVPVDFGEASTAIGGLNQSLGLTGKPLEGLATSVLNLSRITGTDLADNVEATGGLFNSWGTDVSDQVPKLDELFRISQATGISVGDLAKEMTEGGVQFRSAGLSFEESGSLLGLLAKNGLSASDVLPALNKSMAQAAKDGKDAGTVFQDTFDAIKNAPTDVDAAGIALEVFGAKAGPKFAALIREGKLSYEDLAASIAAGGDTIQNAADDTDDWKEKLQLLTNKAFLFLEPIATRVFDAIGAVVTNVVQPAFEWITNHRPILIGTVVAIGVVLVALFSSWAIGAATAAAATLAAAAPFIAVGLAIAGLVAGVIYAYENFAWFRTVVDSVASFFRDILWPILQSTFNWLKDNVPPIIQGVVDVATFLWKNVLDPFISFLGAAFTTGMDVGKVAFDVVKTAVETVSTAVTWLWDNVLSPFVTFLGAAFKVGLDAAKIYFDIWKAAINFVVDAVLWLWNNVLSPFIGFLGGAFSVGIDVGKVAFDIFTTAVQLVTTAVGWLWNNVLTPFIGFLAAGFNLGMSAATLLWDVIKTAVAGVSTAADWLWHNVLEPIIVFLGAAFTTGWNAAKLIIDGISTAIGAVSTAATWLKDEVFKPLVDFLKGAFEEGWSIAKTAIGYVTAPFEKLIDWIQTVIEKAQLAIGFVQDLLGGGVSGTLDLSGLPKPNPGKKVPTFAEGGRVPGPIGAPMLVMAHGGELILNGEQQRGGFREVNLNNYGRDVTRADLVHVLNVVRLGG